MLIVFGALKIELNNLIRSAHIRKKTRESGAVLYWGDMDGRDILFIVTGMGRENAEKAVDIIFRQKGIKEDEETEVLITGFCGAAAGDLKVGDIVAYKKVVDLADSDGFVRNGSQPVLRPHIFLSDKAAGNSENIIRPVVCGCTDHVVSTPLEKKELSAKEGIDVIDMESYWLIEALEKNGLSSGHISCIRAVSDDANGKLPLYFSADTFGKTILYILKSLFISIFFREEFRANMLAFKNIKKAKGKLDRKILGSINLPG